MWTFKALRGVLLAACLATSLVMVMMPGEALAKKPKLLLSEAEQRELKEILKHVKYESSGIDGKPTVVVSGANLQIVNDEGKTATKNGEGNLVIGYDENEGGKHEHTGSHNLILGEEQTFTSYGGLVAGYEDSITKPFATVTGGEYNTASGQNSSVSGGEGNTASGPAAWVGGGEGNTAAGVDASIGGGMANEASGIYSSVSGGRLGVASGESSWAGGGFNARAIGNYSTVGGGNNSKAVGYLSSVDGGVGNEAIGGESWIGGGLGNHVTGNWAAIFGGKELKATKEYEAIP